MSKIQNTVDLVFDSNESVRQSSEERWRGTGEHRSGGPTATLFVTKDWTRYQLSSDRADEALDR